ncbi:MAG: HAD-IB family phosphatase [Acidimicrobiales bacterium]|nr:HAD-IB family phosphatase [Acidimicrobiales bacterium]
MPRTRRLPRIADALDGRRIAVTGSTGFLGTALVERLLRSVPGCEVVLLVRAGRRSTAAQRVQREVLRNDAFGRLRAELGERFADETARRLQVITGDVGADGLGLDEADRAALAACDLVIHSAATVSFDSPLDSAVEVNLLGPSRIAATLQDLGVAPHLISVSTCYVAGTRRGRAPEELLADGSFDLTVPWRAEVDAARRARSDAEAESRTPEMLARFRKQARTELGAAGIPLLADKTEQMRVRWVTDRMVEAGRARATSLGWPDAYAYTKALGEAALAETHGPVPTTIVRPSIIESALAEPHPGWIRGFRMAEPVIISYARGLLKQFPGVPEGTVDVIPVDLVVGALCAVAAKGPEADAAKPPVYQVASGSVNPLKYRTLVEHGRDFFTRNPIYDAAGQPIVVPDWSFPGRGEVQGQLHRAKRLLERAERALNALPLRGRRAELSATVEERRQEVERALGYVELYGAYAECEAIYGVERLLALWDRVQVADRSEFCFDPRVIDWTHYALDVHLPSVVEHARVRTTPGTKGGPTREERLRAAVLAPERHLAVFDLENTLIASNVVDSYAWLATRRLPRQDRLRFVARTLAEAPRLLALDRRDRGDFLRYFYRRYDGAPAAQLDEDARELLSALLLTKSFPAAIRRVREHRALGHRTLLITGALDVVVAPIAPLFDDVVCARMTTRPGPRGPVLTGELREAPPTGEARADVMAEYTAAHGLDLAETVAYADSTSDLPMLEVAGFPVAVNPETRLAALARKRGWLVENWEKAPGGPRPLLPIGPERRANRLRAPHDAAEVRR